MIFFNCRGFTSEKKRARKMKYMNITINATRIHQTARASLFTLNDTYTIQGYGDTTRQFWIPSCFVKYVNRDNTTTLSLPENFELKLTSPDVNDYRETIIGAIAILKELN